MNEESDLLKTNQELREAVRARDEFLAIAAHELRSPMHALMLQVETAIVAARRAGSDDLLQRLERVRRVLDRYVKRATLLLDISRINARSMDLRFEEVDLVEVLRDVVDTYSSEAAFNLVDIRLETPDVLIGTWDRAAIEQVIGNLISNAIKYGDGRPVDVDLTREGARAHLEVKDRGIGISPEDQARIFGRFEQVMTGQARTGFGVGLWLARALIEAHRGSIAVESAPGKGAAFTVWLPLDTAAALQESK
ncbi:MAG TPA: HAMP domain-containing sensor histidine kinase [Steroidobacteraceae bacterium]|jgi:two-component system OmpR family sensor kinase|nr:HAMP domain-containing sensor histidine kinase [Steroidobacteraceae bacterium]